MIHASRTVGETLLPQWLASFRISAPAWRVSVAITNSDEVVHAVRDRVAEIGFIEGPAGSMHGLTELVVAHDALRVVVASGHPWARRREIPLRTLAREPFLAREPGSGTRDVADEALAAKGVELSPALELSSAEGLKRAVLAGGFTLLSERAVEPEVAAGTLRAIPVSGVELLARCARYGAAVLRFRDRRGRSGRGSSVRSRPKPSSQPSELQTHSTSEWSPPYPTGAERCAGSILLAWKPDQRRSGISARTGLPR